MPPSPDDLVLLSPTTPNPPTARIRLVGAGPGDPELLTLKALRALQEADLVVADNLIPKEILSLVRGRLCMAPCKKLNKADRAQDELMQMALEGLLRGEDVIRLKNGDPFVFGRGGEEVLFFRQHGFEAEIIPGISSSLSAPLSALIPVTHRGIADQFLVTTGQGRGGSIPSIPPYAPHRTTVFLMSVARMQDLMQDLIRNGYPPSCPVAVVEKATFPDQRVLRATVESIAERAEREGIESPSTIIIGECVNALL